MIEARRESAGPRVLEDLTGTMVGRFAVRSCLGAGGMGEVYCADDTALKRPVALKRLAPQLRTDQRYRQRFLKEAERASALSHPHIASIYDVLEDKGEPYLVMEYVQGANLRERLREPLPLDQFWNLALQTVEALVAAHEKQIVHGDIKPENIMLTSAGRVKILDFGVAKRLPRADEDAVTETGDTLGEGPSGTPAYMAPEVLLGSTVDCRSDIFSLGLVFYEALAGINPFRTTNVVSTTDRILHETAPPLHEVNPQVPLALSRIVDRMLAKDPAQRYHTANLLLEELRLARRGVLVPPAIPSAAAKTLPELKKRVVVFGAILLVSLIAGLLGWRLIKEKLTPPPAIPQQKNVVVLPFQAIGGNLQQQTFCDGLTATLTVQLTRLTATHPLQVAPANEVWARKVTTVESARKDLGGTLVVAGNLYWSGESLRVNISLEDANTRRLLRAATITSSASDPFAFQDHVVESVVEMLELELRPPERNALTVYGTKHPAAFDLYLQGRGYLQEYQKSENIDHAIDLFHRALEADSNYALARASLGEAFWKKYENTKDTKWMGTARDACEKALALDANLAASHVCLGNLGYGTGQYESAKSEFQKALELESTSDEAYRGLARAEERLGQTREAEQTFLRAIEVRPGYWAGYSWLGNFYSHHGQYENAVRMFQRVVDLAPDNHRGYYNLGAAYFQWGRWAEAVQACKKSLALRESGTAYSNLGTVYFFLGRYEEAARTFELASQFLPRDEYLRGNLADAYRWSPRDAGKAARTYAEAINMAEEELRLDPRSTDLLAHLALYRAKSGETTRALRIITQAMAMAPEDPNLSYVGAVVCHLAGNKKKALALLKNAVAGGYSLNEIRADPELRDLRVDPVFAKLVKIER